MDVISAAADHDEGIHDIAGRSIRASYSLSPEQIDGVVREEFGKERLEERRESDDELALVAEMDGEPVGFATGHLDEDGDGEIDWLFVAPEARGQQVGTRLFEEARDALEERGADTVRVAVLSENEEGGMFVEQFGYERTDNREMDLDEQSLATHIYGPHGEEGGGIDEDFHRPDTVETDDGDTVYTGDEELAGKQAPFLVLYTDEERSEQYGFFCTNCGTMANAADGLDRVDCDTCGNESRPEEWDGSYL